MSIQIVWYLLLIVICAFVGGAILNYVKQPPVVGYILAGVILSVFWQNGGSYETINFLAELGVVLLLFTIGLEFSLSKLKRVAKIAILGGILQIILTILLGFLFISQFGFTVYESLFMAAAFSLSSTAIVVKILSDKGEIDTLPGEIMVAWLVVQDLSVLPMIILLPAINQFFLTSANLISFTVLMQKLLIASGLLVVVVFLGKYIVPKLINFVAKLNSRELLLVAIFGVFLAFALFTQMIGLSAALGAFLAGLLISESDKVNAIFSEIRPLRNLFSLLFFTTLAFALPPGFIGSNFLLILLITGFIMVVKFAIVLLLSIYLGYHAKTSFIVGMALINVGEFAFILARVGIGENIINQQIYGMIVSVTLLSILVAPPLFLAAPQIYLGMREFAKKRLPKFYLMFFTGFDHKRVIEELPFKNHVVLCGFGRVGKYIGRSLDMMKIPYVVIEYNHHKYQQLKEKGIEVVYGDPSDIDILDFAQVDKAKTIIIAIPDVHTQKMVIANSQALNKDIQIICRIHNEEDQSDLKSLGAKVVVQPEFEAALSITSRILRDFGGNKEEIDGKISRLKIEHGLV